METTNEPVDQDTRKDAIDTIDAITRCMTELAATLDEPQQALDSIVSLLVVASGKPAERFNARISKSPFSGSRAHISYRHNESDDYEYLVHVVIAAGTATVLDERLSETWFDAIELGRDVPFAGAAELALGAVMGSYEYGHMHRPKRR